MAVRNPYESLEHNARQDPRGVFSRTLDQTVTNEQAVVSVKKIAYELRRLGVRPGQVVALDLPDRLGILFVFALFHEGAVSTVIPDGVVVDGFDVHWQFTNRASTPQRGAQQVTVDRGFLQHVEENPYGISPSDAPLELLRIAFSSGTTGVPKAIGLGEAWQVASDAAVELRTQSGQALMLMDTGTAFGFSDLYGAVTAGRPYLSVGAEKAEVAVEVAARNSVASISGSPNQFAALVDELERQHRTLPSVEAVLFGGTVMAPGVAERLRAATEGCLIYGLYGSTEAGATAIRMADSDDPFDAGTILPGVVVEIVDDDDEPLPAGEAGNIRVKGPAMVHEYLGDPVASASVFRGGWFYPGDLGLLRPDGGLTLTGRASEVLNSGGVKLDPARLDHVALEHPGVVDVAGFEYAESPGMRRIGLAVVARDDIDVDGLVARLKAEFGAATPTLIARVDEIPRTRTGKPMRRELAARYGGN